MKQLLDVSGGGYVVVGLHDRAFVGRLDGGKKEGAVYELVPPAALLLGTAAAAAAAGTTASAATAANVKADNDDDDSSDLKKGDSTKKNATSSSTSPSPLEIQAVAVTALEAESDGGAKKIYCAVTRYDKSLCVYDVPIGNTSCAKDDEEDNGDGDESETARAVRVQPSAVHRTTKRAGCLCFAQVPPPPQAGDSSSPLSVVISGDMAGDAVAYSLDHSTAPSSSSPPTAANSKGDDDGGKKQRQRDDGGTEEAQEDEGGGSEGGSGNDNSERYRRTLLGHTASTLTGVAVVSNAADSGSRGSRILTSDRDEKVRVSRFPDAHAVEGYLLGHTAFVSCLDAVSSDGVTAGSTRCVTCGGDGTVKLWDYATREQLCSIETRSGGGGDGDGEGADNQEEEEEGPVPSRVAICPDGTKVAVSYDECARMDCFDVSDPKSPRRIETDASLADNSGKNEGAEILALKFLPGSKESLLALVPKPPYIRAHRISGDSDDGGGRRVQLGDESKFPFIDALRKVTDSCGSSITMPRTVLEKDEKSGELKMKKLGEKRGPANVTQPWNDTKRKEIARERNKRRRQRKREQNRSNKQQKTS